MLATTRRGAGLGGSLRDQLHAFGPLLQATLRTGSAIAPTIGTSSILLQSYSVLRQHHVSNPSSQFVFTLAASRPHSSTSIPDALPRSSRVCLLIDSVHSRAPAPLNKHTASAASSDRSGDPHPLTQSFSNPALTTGLGVAVDELAELCQRPLPSLRLAAAPIAASAFKTLATLCRCALDDRFPLKTRGLSAEGARLCADLIAMAGAVRYASSSDLSTAVHAWGAASGSVVFGSLAACVNGGAFTPPVIHAWLHQALTHLLSTSTTDAQPVVTENMAMGKQQARQKQSNKQKQRRPLPSKKDVRYVPNTAAASDVSGPSVTVRPSELLPSHAYEPMPPALRTAIASTSGASTSVSPASNRGATGVASKLIDASGISGVVSGVPPSERLRAGGRRGTTTISAMNSSPSSSSSALDHWSTSELQQLLSGLDCLLPLPGRVGFRLNHAWLQQHAAAAKNMDDSASVVGAKLGDGGYSVASPKMSHAALSQSYLHSSLHEGAVHLLEWSPLSTAVLGIGAASLPSRFSLPPASLGAPANEPSVEPLVADDSSVLSTVKPRTRNRKAIASANEDDVSNTQQGQSLLQSLRARIQRFLRMGKAVNDSATDIRPRPRPYVAVFEPSPPNPAEGNASTPDGHDADDSTETPSPSPIFPSASQLPSKDDPDGIVRYLLSHSRATASPAHAALLRSPGLTEFSALMAKATELAADSVIGKLSAPAALAEQQPTSLPADLADLGLDLGTSLQNRISSPSSGTNASPSFEALANVAMSAASLQLPASHRLWTSLASCVHSKVSAGTAPPPASALVTIAHVLRLMAPGNAAVASAVGAIVSSLLPFSSSLAAAWAGMGVRELSVLASAVSAVLVKGNSGTDASRLLFGARSVDSTQSRQGKQLQQRLSVGDLQPIADATVRQLLPETLLSSVSVRACDPEAGAVDSDDGSDTADTLLLAGPPLRFDATLHRLLPLVRAFGDRLLLSYPPLYATVQRVLVSSLSRSPHSIAGASLTDITALCEALRHGYAGAYLLYVRLSDALTSHPSGHAPLASSSYNQLLELCQSLVRLGVVHGPLLSILCRRTQAVLPTWNRALTTAASAAASTATKTTSVTEANNAWRPLQRPLATACELLRLLVVTGAHAHQQQLTSSLARFIEAGIMARARVIAQSAPSTPSSASPASKSLVYGAVSQTALVSAAKQLLPHKALMQALHAAQAVGPSTGYHSFVGSGTNSGNDSATSSGAMGAVCVGQRLPPPAPLPSSLRRQAALLHQQYPLFPARIVGALAQAAGIAGNSVDGSSSGGTEFVPGIVEISLSTAGSSANSGSGSNIGSVTAGAGGGGGGSVFERRLWLLVRGLCRDLRIPQPVRNAAIGSISPSPGIGSVSSGGACRYRPSFGGDVSAFGDNTSVFTSDFVWPDARVAIEADGPTHFLPLSTELQLCSLGASISAGVSKLDGLSSSLSPQEGRSEDDDDEEAEDGRLEALIQAAMGQRAAPAPNVSAAEGSRGSGGVSWNPSLTQSWPVVPISPFFSPSSSLGVVDSLDDESAAVKQPGDGTIPSPHHRRLTSLSPLSPFPAPGSIVATASPSAYSSSLSAPPPPTSGTTGSCSTDISWACSTAPTLEDQLRRSVLAQQGWIVLHVSGAEWGALSSVLDAYVARARASAAASPTAGAASPNAAAPGAASAEAAAAVEAAVRRAQRARLKWLRGRLEGCGALARLRQR